MSSMCLSEFDLCAGFLPQTKTCSQGLVLVSTFDQALKKISSRPPSPVGAAAQCSLEEDGLNAKSKFH